MSYSSRKRGLWPRVLCPGGLTSTHTPWCARRSPPSVEAVFQFTTRMVDNTVDLYAAKPDICPESRFLPTHLHSTSPLEGFLSEYCHAVRYGKSRMVWLPDPGVKKFRKYLHSFWHNSRTCDGRTDRQTDKQTSHDDIGRAYASHRAAKTNNLQSQRLT